MAAPDRHPMPVQILSMEATRKEVEEFLDLDEKAFKSDPFLELCFNRPGVPEEPRESKIAYYLERLKSTKFMFHKAVDRDNPSGPILGICKWYWGDDPRTETVNTPWGDWPPGAHVDCLEASLGILRRWRLNHFREHNQPYAYLAELIILPEAQRRGIGSALISEGLKEVDRRGRPTFLESSPAGRGLYTKFGWEEALGFNMNLKDYGGIDMEVRMVALLRPPSAL